LNFEEDCDLIAETTQDPAAKVKLRCCGMEDRSVWLRQILRGYGFRFGFNIIPSFNAAIQNRPRNNHTNAIRQHAQSIAVKEVAQLDNCLNLITGDIKTEYVRMRHGQSAVKDSLVNCRHALDAIVSLL